MSLLMTPLEFVQATQHLFKLCAVRFPIGSKILPVFAFTGLGLLCMEVTNSNNAPTTLVDIDNRKGGLSNVNRGSKSIYEEAFRSDHGGESDALVDPYNSELMSELEEKKRMKMKPETRRVYDMLKGLKNKTREEKLRDAFNAYDNFMTPQNQNDGQKL